MEKKVMDFTPYLHGDEKLLIKQECNKGSGALIELAVFFTLWLICIALDCFMIGAMSQIKTVVKFEENYFFVLIPALLIHIVPFGAWFLAILKRLSPISNKWYAVTDKRIAVVTGIKPISVTFLDFSDVTSVLLATNKVTVKFGEEKLVLNGLENAEAIYDVLVTTIFPETPNGETAFAERAPKVATEPMTEPGTAEQTTAEQTSDEPTTPPESTEATTTEQPAAESTETTTATATDPASEPTTEPTGDTQK